MSPVSRANYEKRIASLQAELREARSAAETYRSILSDIYEGATDVEGSGVNRNWLLKKFRRAWRYP